jgi:hypothetical protein
MTNLETLDDITGADAARRRGNCGCGCLVLLVAAGIFIPILSFWVGVVKNLLGW